MEVNVLVSKKVFTAYKELLDYLNEIKEKMAISSTLEKLALLEEMFFKIKEYSLLFYEKGKFPFFYQKILTILIECENMCDGFHFNSKSSEYIIDSIMDVYSTDRLLDFIATNIRKKVIGRNIN